MKALSRLALVGLLGVACSDGGSGVCNTPTENTVLFEPPLTGVGDYTFEVEIDGQAGECEVTMTADGAEGATCTPSEWAVFLKYEGKANGDRIEPIPPKEILGLLVGTAAASEVMVKVAKDDDELFDDTVPLEPDTVTDAECGDLERLLATAEISE